MNRTIVFLATLLAVGGVVFVLLRIEQGEPPSGPGDPSKGSTPDGVGLQGSSSAEGIQAVSSMAPGPPTVAFSADYLERKSLLDDLRVVARDAGAMDFTQSHAAVFRRFRRERRAHAGRMGPTLRDVVELPEHQDLRAPLTHLALSALEGMAPLGKVDGRALSSLLRSGALGQGVFEARALRVLGDHAPTARALAGFLVRVLMEQPRIRPETIDAIGELAQRHDDLLRAVRRGLVRHRGSEQRLHEALAIVSTDDRILQVLAVVSGRGSADEVDQRDTLRAGLQVEDRYVALLAATALHDRQWVEPAELWDLVSGGLSDEEVARIRLLAFPLAGVCAPTPAHLMVTCIALMQRGGRVQRMGLRLAMGQLRRLGAGAFEAALRKLPLGTRKVIAHLVAYGRVYPDDPLPAGVSTESATRDGTRFFAKVLLSDAVAEVRRQALKTFGADPAMRDLVEPLRNDPDPDVAAAANQALSRDE